MRLDRIWPRFFGAAIAAMLLVEGCAAVQNKTAAWFGTATPTPQAARGAESAAAVYYSGTDGLTVYGAPSASAKIVGKLALHEKVTRSKLERGYAYVESTTGLKGWVNNAQLIWRLPGKPAPAAAEPPEPQGGEAATPAVEEPPETAPAEPAATAAAPEPTPTPTLAAAVPSGATPTSRSVAPSIFNPY